MGFFSKIFKRKPNQEATQQSERPIALGETTRRPERPVAPDRTMQQPVKIIAPSRISWSCPVCVAGQGQAQAWNGMVASALGDIDDLCLHHREVFNQKLNDIKTGNMTLAGLTAEGKEFFHRNQEVTCNYLILTAMYQGAGDDEQKTYWRGVLTQWREYATNYCNHFGNLCSDGRRENQARAQYRQEHRDDPL